MRRSVYNELATRFKTLSHITSDPSGYPGSLLRIGSKLKCFRLIL